VVLITVNTVCSGSNHCNGSDADGDCRWYVSQARSSTNSRHPQWVCVVS